MGSREELFEQPQLSAFRHAQSETLRKRRRRTLSLEEDWRGSQSHVIPVRRVATSSIGPLENFGVWHDNRCCFQDVHVVITCFFIRVPCLGHYRQLLARPVYYSALVVCLFSIRA